MVRGWVGLRSFWVVVFSEFRVYHASPKKNVFASQDSSSMRTSAFTQTSTQTSMAPREGVPCETTRQSPGEFECGCGAWVKVSISCLCFLGVRCLASAFRVWACSPGRHTTWCLCWVWFRGAGHGKVCELLLCFFGCGWAGGHGEVYDLLPVFFGCGCGVGIVRCTICFGHALPGTPPVPSSGSVGVTFLKKPSKLPTYPTLQTVWGKPPGMGTPGAAGVAFTKEELQTPVKGSWFEFIFDLLYCGCVCILSVVRHRGSCICP